MTKYANESTAGASRARSYGAGRSERMPTGGPNSEPPAVQKVDPSVRLGDLTGEIMGNVPMARQMAKPAAYREKKGAP